MSISDITLPAVRDWYASLPKSDPKPEIVTKAMVAASTQVRTELANMAMAEAAESTTSLMD